MADWKPDRILRIILVWTVITMIVVWLPFVRGPMDGDSYRWGNNLWGVQIGGAGVHGDYWVLVLEVIFGLTLLYLGWRGARQPFHWLLLLWHVPLGMQAIHEALTSPEDYRFRGDTLGVDVSLAWVGPLFFGGFALLSSFWVVRDLGRTREKLELEWNRVNRVLLLIALGLLPVQFMLLRFGVPHGPGDQVGVILTMMQWVLINFALFPWSRRRSSEAYG